MERERYGLAQMRSLDPVEWQQACATMREKAARQRTLNRVSSPEDAAAPRPATTPSSGNEAVNLGGKDPYRPIGRVRVW